MRPEAPEIRPEDVVMPIPEPDIASDIADLEPPQTYAERTEELFHQVNDEVKGEMQVGQPDDTEAKPPGSENDVEK